jgi:hypothetical protein
MRTPDAETQSLQQPDSDKGWIVFGKMEKEPIIEPRRPGDPWFLMRRHRRKSKRVITDPATGVPLEDANAADMDEYDEYDEADGSGRRLVLRACRAPERQAHRREPSFQ